MVSDDDPVYVNEGLALSLASVTLLGAVGQKNYRAILKTVRNAVCEGAPLTSRYIAKVDSRAFLVSIRVNQKPTSVLMSIKNLFKGMLTLRYRPSYYDNTPDKIKFFKAIIQGEEERRKTLTDIRDNPRTHALGKLKADMPKEIIFLILSFLPKYHDDQERRALIEKIKKEFDEEQQGQFSPDEE